MASIWFYSCESPLPFEIPQEARDLGTYEVRALIVKLSTTGKELSREANTTLYENNEPSKDFNLLRVEFVYDDKDSLITRRIYEPEYGKSVTLVGHWQYNGTKNSDHWTVKNNGDTIFWEHREYTDDQQVRNLVIESYQEEGPFMKQSVTTDFDQWGRANRVVMKEDGTQISSTLHVYNAKGQLSGLNTISYEGGDTTHLSNQYSYGPDQLLTRQLQLENETDTLSDIRFENGVIHHRISRVFGYKTAELFDDQRRLLSSISTSKSSPEKEVTQVFYQGENIFKLKYTLKN